MNNALFTSMQTQLQPSDEAVDRLREAAVQPARPRRKRYYALAACAACAALALLAWPVYRAMNPPLHSYTAAEMGAFQETAAQSGPALTAGDLEVGGAYVGVKPVTPAEDVAAQEQATAAYQALMEEFSRQYGPGGYPDWYGGAYITDDDFLIVAVVDQTAEDKALYLEIQAMAQSQRVGFSDARYSLRQLLDLQTQVVSLLEGTDFNWGCGVDEMDNCLDLQLFGEPGKALLAELYKLDPAGDAIAVTVSEGALYLTDVMTTLPASPIEPAEDLPDTPAQCTQAPVEESAQFTWPAP